MISLDASLKSYIYNKKSEGEQTIIERNWERIKNLIAQNAGLKNWGSHLNEMHLEVLKTTADKTITTIETVGFGEIFKSTSLPGIEYLIFNKVGTEHLNLKNLEAVFLKYNSEFANNHFEYLENVFKELANQNHLEEKAPIIREMLINHLISYLPFFGLEDKKEIQLPRFIDNAWQLVSYTIDQIVLSGEIKAFGLTPSNQNPKAHPVLIFRGTPYPALPGFLDAVLSDVHPWKDVGEDLFEKSKSNLANWITGKVKVDAYGISLGGALASFAADTYGDKINLYAFGAPGITSKNGKNIYGRSFYHDFDFVKYIGYLPESDNLETYFVLSDTSPNRFSAHARPLGIEPAILIKITAAYENATWARFFANMFKRVTSPVASLCLIPLKYALILINTINSLLSWVAGTFKSHRFAILLFLLSLLVAKKYTAPA